MLSRKQKRAVFVLGWLNNYATAYYFNYLFFYMREDFGFGNRGNLFLAALSGFFYTFCAVLGGKWAQKFGYFWSLRFGFTTMFLALGAGLFLPNVPGQFAVMIVWTFGMCFTWPALEALVSENEPRLELSRIIGIYNVVWASAAAVSYFTGGSLLSALGPKSLFWLPMAVHVAQVVIAVLIERSGIEPLRNAASQDGDLEEGVEPQRTRIFLRMAWLANPFAYVAANTVIPLIPHVADKLGLSTMLAGFVGSVWMFARLFAFFALWKWVGWHYKFRWLITSYLVMVVCFAALLLIPNIAVIVVAQLFFGLAVGLIYYSSLFYSMHVGDTKAEHGGFHEALIGLGIFLGPAFGSAALHFAPNVANAGIWAVSGLLVCGAAALAILGIRSRR